jgi:hypothetical protein
LCLIALQESAETSLIVARDPAPPTSRRRRRAR